MIPLELYSGKFIPSYKARMGLQWFLMLNVPQGHVVLKACLAINQWHYWEMIEALGDEAVVKHS